MILKQRRQMLEQLPSDTFTNLYQELVQMFLDSAPAKIKQMKQLFSLLDSASTKTPQLSSTDHLPLCREAHSLKSSCGNLGLVELQCTCQAIEDLEDRWNPALCRTLLDQLHKNYELVLPELKEILRGTKAS